MRTIRVLRPRSFRFLFLSFGLPLAVAGLLLSFGLQSVATLRTTLFGVALAARLLRSRELSLNDLWLLPVRDLLLCWVWWRASRTSVVMWRGNEFAVDAQGIMRSVS
jgi:ceramide glucosyltransferase